eukprot:1162147-Pelagomonas_calceolata.AAC.8
MPSHMHTHRWITDHPRSAMGARRPGRACVKSKTWTLCSHRSARPTGKYNTGAHTQGGKYDRVTRKTGWQGQQGDEVQQGGECNRVNAPLRVGAETCALCMVWVWVDGSFIKIGRQGVHTLEGKSARRTKPHKCFKNWPGAQSLSAQTNRQEGNEGSGTPGFCTDSQLLQNYAPEEIGRSES